MRIARKDTAPRVNQAQHQAGDPVATDDAAAPLTRPQPSRGRRERKPATRSRLTTTSFMVLGMLSTRDWSAYEIAEVLGKGMTEVWPRLSRQLYNTPKQLVAEGLATASVQATGRRTRTVYSITPAGRRALSAWLATDPAPASLEFEGMVRVILADQGSLDDLTHTLHQVREQAQKQRDRFRDHARFIKDTGGTFPERAHLFELTTAFMLGHFTHMADWATWALEQLEDWQDTAAPSSPPDATER